MRTKLVRRFAREGGSQLLLLGAGFDCRAARLGGDFAGGTVFEVDHPATQRQKRAVLERLGATSAPVRYLAWDFEREKLGDLPARLATLGHDETKPTLTIWEGVTMYLTPPAIESTVDAVRALSAAGSPFVFTYFDRDAIGGDGALEGRFVRRFVARVGEPFRFGWAPSEVRPWMLARGFSLEWDRMASELAQRYLPPAVAGDVRDWWRRVAVARRAP